jgi:hypothetical protein
MPSKRPFKDPSMTLKTSLTTLERPLENPSKRILQKIFNRLKKGPLTDP